MVQFVGEDTLLIMSVPEKSTPDGFESLLIINLSTYPTSKQSKKAAKAEVKVKETSFTLSEANYVDFLHTLLAKHNKDIYKVSEKKGYVFKYLYPPSKAQKDAIDVDNAEDYQSMVSKIIDEKPKKIKIYVDMHNVTKLPRRKETDNRTSELERDLAEKCIAIEKRWHNEHDGGFTYIFKDGTLLPLTPQMIKEWCRAWRDRPKNATTPNDQVPPNTQAFDPAKQQPLNLARRSALPSAFTPPLSSGSGFVDSASEVHDLTSVLLLQAVRDLTQRSAPPNIMLPVPETPARKNPLLGSSDLSPALPTPSKLTRYLLHAEKNLGVPNATMYEPLLALQGIGPDIMTLVDDKVFLDVGLTIGDVVRLKKGSDVWWNGPDAKRKRSDTESQVATVPAAKRIDYEKHYTDGGASRFIGPPMEPGDGRGDVDAPPPDYKIWYLCETHKAWFEVPRGYVVTEEGGPEDDPFT
ncbi:hypothetical protein BJ138DRAFT_1019850 [Hygrophoropsis aurantiaca]|uniref:Uncharacterized protein n=1 Tax=Hygrophoropsis aurantiaca TaxID=72124 RepID=A0ACB7ZS03_9AGAM|nr:hypothetical protein BJ138DRAFT_1019850 [Hygrophoropsis aurantiaca]